MKWWLPILTDGRGRTGQTQSLRPTRSKSLTATRLKRRGRCERIVTEGRMRDAVIAARQDGPPFSAAIPELKTRIARIETAAPAILGENGATEKQRYPDFGHRPAERKPATRRNRRHNEVSVVEQEARWNGCDILLHQGDITELATDAIVNAANSELWAGGGVCGAIHRRAGRALAEECSLTVSRSGRVPEGQAVITTGGALTARHVIHAVGPVYDGDPARAPDLLASAYRNALSLAREHGLRTGAFPCVGTGAFGYPPEEACRVAVDAVRADVESYGGLDQVVFCVFETSDLELYERALSDNSGG